MAYVKLFQEILDSTVWRETDSTRLVWISMLAMANRDGEVMASIPGLADRARVSMSDCLRALEAFQAPDMYSRTKDFDGRRIQEIDGGWLLLNYKKFRERMSALETREKTAARVRKWRALHGVTKVTYNESNDIAAPEAEAEAKEEIGSDTDSLAVATTAPPKVLMVFPCNGEPNTWSLTEPLVKRWSYLFPTLDIMAECFHALAWIESNHRKTYKGMPKFLNGWFSRANDRIRSNSAAKGKTSNNENVALAFMAKKGLLP